MTPADDANLETIAPLYQVDVGADMAAINMWLWIEVATDPGFTNRLPSMGYSYFYNPPDRVAWQADENLAPGQRFYWRARLVCQEGAYRYGPYADTWSFVSGSGGTLPSAPELLLPVDGALVPDSGTTLNWTRVAGAIGYKMNTLGSGWRWVTAPPFWLQWTKYWIVPGDSVQWRVATLNEYGIGPYSQVRTFTSARKTVQIEPGGGALTYVDSQGNQTSFAFPAGAVDRSTIVTITLTTPATNPDGFSWTGHGFSLEASQDGQAILGLTFGIPVPVTIHYTDIDLAGMTEDSLLLMVWDEAQARWMDAACGPFDRHPADNWLTVPICHASTFGLFGIYPYHTYLPLVMR